MKARHWTRWLLLALVTVLAVNPATVRHAAADNAALYRVTDLGTLGGTFSFPFGLNNRGQVVGMSTLAGDVTYHAFLWQNGVMTDLPALPGGGAFTMANSINDAGQIVGQSDFGQPTTDANGQFCTYAFFNCDAVLWDSIGTVHDLGTLGGANSEANGINARGQVVGDAETMVTATTTGQPQYVPFIWQNGSMRALSSTLGGYNADANAINNAGLIVGDADPSGDLGHRCALWSGGQFMDLGSLGGLTCTPTGVNARGQVVGKAWPNGVNFSPIEWQDGHLSVLPTYPGDPDGAALGINDRGLIVGGSTSIPGYLGRAVMWHDGSIVDLNTLIPAGTGLQLDLAHLINAAGQITGGAVVNGEYHTFLLTPSRDVSTALAALTSPPQSSAYSAVSMPALPAVARRFLNR